MEFLIPVVIIIALLVSMLSRLEHHLNPYGTDTRVRIPIKEAQELESRRRGCGMIFLVLLMFSCIILLIIL